MPIILKNNASSALAAGITATDTGIVVRNGNVFPTLAAGEYFYATLVGVDGSTEIVKVTARSGAGLAVVRAQEGTLALPFPVDSRVELRITAASITDLVDERDQASEISFTPTGTIAATNVQNAIAEVSGDVTAISAASGSSLVGYTQGGTGAATRTVQARLRDSVSVKDFGAVGDGVTDDTVALQAAINNFKVDGKPILMDGDFRVTAPLVYQTQGDSSGLRLIGTGVYNSSIIGDFTGTSLIDIDGSSLQVGRFQYGGGFSDIRLTTAAGAAIENGIRVNGWWDANHKNLQIGELGSPTFTKNGIFIPLRTDISANPDFYASVRWALDGVVIDSMGEYGIFGANNTGYAGWIITGGGFSRNGLDGLYVNTNGWRVSNCGASYNGRYGVNYTGTSGVTLTNGYFSQLELDGNATAGLRISRVTSGIFENVRFISRVLDGSETQLTHVLGDSAQTCTSVAIKNSYHRVESGITSGVTLYDFGSVAGNIQGNTIEGFRLLNSAGVTVTEVTASLLDRRYKNFVQGSLGAQRIASPTKFAHSSFSSQAITSVLSTWVFNETVAPTGWTDYNTTTGELTAPHGGFYSFYVTFTCTSVPTNERFIVNLVKNGTVDKSWYWDWPSGVGADRWSFDAADLLSVVAGDVIKIQVVNTTGTATLFGRAKLSIFCV